MTTNEDIRRSTLRHFIPGMALFWLGALMVSQGLPPWQGMALLATETVAMVLGYHLTLKKTKKRTRRLSRVRAFAAGLVAPPLAAAMFTLVPGLRFVFGMPGLVVLATTGAFTAGCFMAATMFVRRRRPEFQEPAIVAELPGESLEEWFARVEKEADRQPWYRSLKSAVTRIVTPPITRRDLCAAIVPVLIVTQR